MPEGMVIENGLEGREISIEELVAQAKGTAPEPTPAAVEDQPVVPGSIADAPIAEVEPEPKPDLPRASADQLRSRSGLGEEVLQYQELGFSIKVRGLKVSERNQIESESFNYETGGMDLGEVVVGTIIAGTIEPNLQEDSREWVEGLPDPIVNSLYYAIRRLSGMDKASREAAAATFRDGG